MLASAQWPHLHARRLARLVSVSPGDLGSLSVMGREGVSNDHCVPGSDHSTVPGHGDGCQHVVTWIVITKRIYYESPNSASTGDFHKIFKTCEANLKRPTIRHGFRKNNKDYAVGYWESVFAG